MKPSQKSKPRVARRPRDTTDETRPSWTAKTKIFSTQRSGLITKNDTKKDPEITCCEDWDRIACYEDIETG